jgi:hypothetical protein
MKSFPTTRSVPTRPGSPPPASPTTPLPATGGISRPASVFVWDGQRQGGWVLRGGGGYYYGRTNPALFSEAALFDGTIKARRAQGVFPGWPAVPDSVAAPVIGPRMTLFDNEYHVPRPRSGTCPEPCVRRPHHGGSVGQLSPHRFSPAPQRLEPAQLRVRTHLRGPAYLWNAGEAGRTGFPGARLQSPLRRLRPGERNSGQWVLRLLSR